MPENTAGSMHTPATPNSDAFRSGSGCAAVPHGTMPAGCGREEVIDLGKTPPRKIRVGLVTLVRLASGRWSARLTDPKTGRDVRRIIPVESEKEARDIALELSRKALSARGLAPKADASLPVRTALLEAIRATGSGELSQARSARSANQFLAWLREHAPEVMEWGSVRPSHVSAWVRSMQKRELRFDTLRLALHPVKHASRYWAAEFPEKYRDFVGAAKVKLERPKRSEVRALSAPEVRAFLEWLEVNAPALWPLACLSAFAGLRMLEAAAVRFCDLDLTAGTVAIEKTPTHTPKTRSSFRVVPLAPMLVEAIRHHVHGAKVLEANVDAPVFLNFRGRPWTFHGLMGAWQTAMVKARKSLPFLEGFKPHSLRACFATIARQGKADVRALQVFLGHTPTDLLGRHYEAVSMEDLRRDVLFHFAKVWEATAAEFWQKSGASSSHPQQNQGDRGIL